VLSIIVNTSAARHVLTGIISQERRLFNLSRQDRRKYWRRESIMKRKKCERKLDEKFRPVWVGGGMRDRIRHL